MRRLLSLVVLAGILSVVSGDAQTPATRTGRPVDPAAIENLNRLNDDRVKRGLKPILAPGYTYDTADKRAATPASPAAPAAPAILRWVELVNRPEFWPAQCALKETLEFDRGITIKAGQKVKVDSIQRNVVELSTLDDKTQFDAAPEQTDLLAIANAEYAKLTPKQRELSDTSLTYRRELWPYRVKLTQTFDLGHGFRVKPGDEAILLNIDRSKVFLLTTDYKTRYEVPPKATDVLMQARQFVEAKDGAPSRLTAELEGKLINSVTGKPDPLPADARPRYFVYFRCASWCSITRQFAPTLVKYYNDTKPKHPEFEIVYIMTETPADTGKFAKELGFAWRAVEYTTTAKMPVTNSSKPFSDLIPQVVVMDNTGKVLANGIRDTAPAALAQLDALLNKPVEPK
jgi:Thioredoxin-like